MPRTPEQIEQWKRIQIEFLTKILNHGYVELDLGKPTGSLMIDYGGNALDVTESEQFIVALHRRGS